MAIAPLALLSTVNPSFRIAPVTAVIVLLVWMYVLALIGLIGCEFNAVYERSAR